MAKKQKKTASGGLSKQQQREADAKARAQEEKRQQERAEAVEKNAQLSRVFLYAILGVIALFCLYTLVRTLIGSAASVAELRDNWLFVSLVSLPYLLITVAVIIRKLRKKRRAEGDKCTRLLSTLIFLLVIVMAAAAFFLQLYKGRADAKQSGVYPQAVAALRQDGRSVTEPEEVYVFRTLLESSLQTELRCGETDVSLNAHEGSGFIAGQFVRQLRKDYAAFASTEDTADGKTVIRWDPVSGSEEPRAALCVRQGKRVVICELKGPETELKELLDALQSAFD